MATPKRASDGARRSEREQRTYRACAHCRQRKSRCIFNETPGKTPCARCYREGRDCVISPAGKQRERRVSARRLSETQDVATEVAIDEGPGGFGGTQNPADALDFLARVASNAGDGADSRAAASGQQVNRPDHPIAGFGPSPTLIESTPTSTSPNFGGPSTAPGSINYRPISEGHLSVAGAQKLLQRYRENYHSYFPIANKQMLDPKNIFSKALEEPHLLTAILTIASKDDPDYSTIHSAVSDHMQRLVSALVYTGPADVEAVEALLILAEWAPQPYSFMAKVGRGEEDRGAWMQVGLAVRLGYLQGLDQTSREIQKGNGDTKRRRLAWAACYMSDRQISVRVGKAFWSRGPSNMSSSDIHECFAAREGVNENNDEADVFQANYELTQLFSNAHDILYASRDHRDRLFSTGDYAKYLDDFRTALRQWNENWGTISCPAHLKSSLILSYEYLRLYINSFAYQATLSRALAASSASSRTGSRGSWSSHFATVAGQPDARFIYEAFDAAKVLLSTFSSFIDPVTCLRFMPLKYYLYVIYSAVFLYKAMATSVTGPDSNGAIRRMIHNTIERLQRSSIHTDHLGNRYSRMLRLLWGRTSHSKEGGEGNVPDGIASSRQSRTPPPSTAPTALDQKVLLSVPTSSQPASGVTGVAGIPGPLPPPHGPTERSMSTGSMGGGQGSEQVLLGAFSWRDLDAVGQFATHNNNMDGMSVVSGNGSQFGVGEVEDPFAYFSAENQGALWVDLDLSPGDVIF